jgi:hypothetical protein
MKKVIIKLSTAGNLDDKYKKLIENLIEISGYYSIIERKDNDDIWTEKEIWEEKTYTITSEFTKNEIEYLQKNYNIVILE